MYKKNFFLFIFLLTLSSCHFEKKKSDLLNMNLGFEPSSLDWNLANDSYSFDVISNIMVGLTRFDEDEDGKLLVKPACAKSWTKSKDGLDYIFYLDPKAKWTDGRKVKAQDFMDSIKRTLDPNTGAPYADLISIIDLEKSLAINDQTLKLHLKHPASYFIYLSSYTLLLPIRLDLIKKYGDKWTEPEYMISNGPYILKEWQHEYKILLERNPDYFLEDSAKIKYIKMFMVSEQSSAFTLYKNNQLDWIDGGSIPSSEIKNLKSSDYTSKLLLRNSFIGFNTKKAPFDDPLVRKAFSYSINRKNLVKMISRGYEPNATWIPPALKDFHDSSRGLDYKPDEARSLLKKAGFPEGRDFPKVKFLIPSNEESKLNAEALQAMWKEELGVKVDIEAMEWKVFMETLRIDTPDLYKLNWGADYPDPDTFMQLFSTYNQINYGSWSNLEYDALINKAAAIDEISTRRRLYLMAEQILTKDEMAIAPLYINTQILMRKSNIKNLRVNSMDMVFLNKVEKE